jgi:poly(A) polymerase
MKNDQVHGPEADIDALCVGPCYATLEVGVVVCLRSFLRRETDSELSLSRHLSFMQDDFFIVLYNMLKKTAEVSEVQCVKSANVPLMRFKFSGISIDLLYARLSLRTIPEVSVYSGFEINIIDIHCLSFL